MAVTKPRTGDSAQACLEVIDSLADTATDTSSAASCYWAGNLDPQNLERERSRKPSLTVRDEIVFASTPDVEAARRWLLRARKAPACVIDIGAGLGAASFMFARRGTWVICIDSSIDRLRQLRRRAREAKCDHMITTIVARAEALPFADRSMPALFTKSVLIHTDLEQATREVGRILSPEGRAAFVEPLAGNPFAWAYRRTIAPKAWRTITRYFDGSAHAVCFRNIGKGYVKPFFLFSFLAFVFQFAWPNLDRFSRALAPLHQADQWLFAQAPWLRRFAWFGVVEVEKPADPTGLPPLENSRSTR